MKPKEFNKKLFLNKRTIAHLGNKEMSGAHGGGASVKPTCIPIATRSCPTNDSYPAGGACCCGGDTTIEIC
jgi:hypothetical protein